MMNVLFILSSTRSGMGTGVRAGMGMDMGAGMDADMISSIFGWISIGCWIIVYTPQFYENYRLQSGDGLSVLFLSMWIIGDLCGLLGALVAELVKTVVLLGCYYLCCDLGLIGQVWWYRWKRNKKKQQSQSDGNGNGNSTERDALLQGPGPLSRSNEDPEEEEESLGQLTIRYTLCLCFVTICGIVAWWFDKGNGRSGEGSGDGNERISESKKWVIQILGWSSAFLYLTAHVPQILKNFETRCKGISPALFLFSIFGSFTYAISICAKSMEKEYLIMNASWLVGHLLTGVLDGVVISQIVYYRFTKQGRAEGVENTRSRS